MVYHNSYKPDHRLAERGYHISGLTCLYCKHARELAVFPEEGSELVCMYGCGGDAPPAPRHPRRAFDEAYETARAAWDAYAQKMLAECSHVDEDGLCSAFEADPENQSEETF